MLDFLRALGESADPEKMEATQRQMLRQCLADLQAGPAVALGEATEMLRHVQNAKLPAAFKEELVSCVKDKASGGVSVPAQTAKAEGKTQRHDYVYNYLTGLDWQTLRSDDASKESKRQLLGRRLFFVGLKFPAESCFKLLLAILLLSCHHGALECFTLDHVEAFKELEKMKKTVRATLGTASCSGIKDYPEKVAELPEELRKAATRDGEPARCPLDVACLTSLTTQLPARKTHSSVAAMNVPFKASKKDGPFNDFMQMAMWQMMQNSCRANPSNANLTFFQGADASAGNKRQKLAIEDVGAGPSSQVSRKQEPEAAEPCKQLALPSQPQHEDHEDEAAQAESVDKMALALAEQLQANKTPSRKAPKELETGTPDGDKKKAPPKAKAKAKGKAKASAAKKAGSVLDLPFPGVSTKPPLRLSCCTVYTSTKAKAWRVQLSGQKKDKAFSWKSRSPADAWASVKTYLADVGAETL